MAFQPQDFNIIVHPVPFTNEADGKTFYRYEWKLNLHQSSMQNPKYISVFQTFMCQMVMQLLDGQIQINEGQTNESTIKFDLPEGVAQAMKDVLFHMNLVIHENIHNTEIPIIKPKSFTP